MSKKKARYYFVGTGQKYVSYLIYLRQISQLTLVLNALLSFRFLFQAIV